MNDEVGTEGPDDEWGLFGDESDDIGLTDPVAVRAAQILSDLGAWAPETADYFVLTAGMSSDGTIAVQIIERSRWTFDDLRFQIGTRGGDRRTWLLTVARCAEGSWSLTSEGPMFDNSFDAYEAMWNITGSGPDRT